MPARDSGLRPSLIDVDAALPRPSHAAGGSTGRGGYQEVPASVSHLTRFGLLIDFFRVPVRLCMCVSMEVFCFINIVLKCCLCFDSISFFQDAAGQSGGGAFQMPAPRRPSIEMLTDPLVPRVIFKSPLDETDEVFEEDADLLALRSHVTDEFSTVFKVC